MQDFNSPALLLQLRTWIAAQEDIDEIWLERFYFDALGKARVSGFATRPQDKEKALRHLPTFLPRFDSQKLPPIEKAPGEPTGASRRVEGALTPAAYTTRIAEQEPKDDGPLVLDVLPSVGQHLRDNIPKVKTCDGLRIDRCFYDPNGVLRIEGLADHAGQSNELKQFLDVENAPFDRKRQLPRGWSEGRQVVIALRPMMASLAENLPSLPEFDGLRFSRAHHDPKNRLVLTGQAVGDPDPQQLANSVKKLLQTHPRWRLRTTFGVVVEISDKRPADVELANRLTFRALHLLQVNIGEARVDPIPHASIGWLTHAWPFEPGLPRALPTDNDYDAAIHNLDAALLHNPKSVLAWYLRGYLLQTKNRIDLAQRDFRRMAALEAQDPELRHNRILALELVQGVLRQNAFRIEQRAMIEIADEWTLRFLRESPTAPDTAK
jgi:tetratricopeptide (TPR) repeat protein